MEAKERKSEAGIGFFRYGCRTAEFCLTEMCQFLAEDQPRMSRGRIPLVSHLPVSAMESVWIPQCHSRTAEFRLIIWTAEFVVLKYLELFREIMHDLCL